jgi:hypothetical protein
MPHEELRWTDCTGLCEGKTVHTVESDLLRCCTCGVSHEAAAETPSPMGGD